VQELAHRLELQAGLAPKAAQGRQGALVAAHGREAPAHSAEAGGGDGLGTGVEATLGHRGFLLFRLFLSVAGAAST
jgi:hypothetical protein